MGRLKRPRESNDAEADELMKKLPARLYVYPEVVDEMAGQQLRGHAFYGSCVCPSDPNGACRLSAGSTRISAPVLGFPSQKPQVRGTCTTQVI